MKTVKYLSLLSLVLFLTACANQEPKSEQTKRTAYEPATIQADVVTDVTLTDSLDFLLKRRGKKLAHMTQIALKKELKKSIQQNGLEASITFCSDRAMKITDSVSVANEVWVKRLAKKYRNPLNETLGDDSTLFKSYIINWLNGAKLEPIIRWDREGHPVYYSPITVDALCLNCHGSVDKNIPANVAERIAQLYPGDKAVDFKEGQLRGMWAITFPEYRVVEVDLSQQKQ